MNKNYYSIDLRNAQNGYTVSCNWKKSETGKDGQTWESYQTDYFVFVSWDEVVKFITENKLSVPPVALSAIQASGN